MRLERIKGALFLRISEELSVPFKEEWIEQLQLINTLTAVGDFLRDTLYPALTDEERKVWRRCKINNRDLLNLVQDYNKSPPPY